jgi:hypothetical protein
MASLEKVQALLPTPGSPVARISRGTAIIQLRISVRDTQIRLGVMVGLCGLQRRTRDETLEMLKRRASIVPEVANLHAERSGGLRTASRSERSVKDAGRKPRLVCVRPYTVGRNRAGSRAYVTRLAIDECWLGKSNLHRCIDRVDSCTWYNGMHRFLGNPRALWANKCFYEFIQ